MPARPAARRDTTAAFFDVVRRQLADVPWERRQELLADVAARLQGLPEHARPEEVLGDPRSYARLVREAAGLPRNRVAPFPYFRALRLRNKVLVVIIPLVIALVGGGLTAMRHYQPLRADAMFGYSSARPVNDPLVTDTAFSHYERNATVVTGIELRNSGRVTVTVTGVRMPTGSPFALVSLRAQPDLNLGGQWQRAKRVRRLSVHPGEDVELFVVMKMTAVRLDVGDFARIDQPPLTVEVLGAKHSLQPAGNGIGVVR